MSDPKRGQGGSLCAAVPSPSGEGKEGGLK
jgi:hypothetical protein